MKHFSFELYLSNGDVRIPVPGVFDERCDVEILAALCAAGELGFTVEIEGEYFEDEN